MSSGSRRKKAGRFAERRGQRTHGRDAAARQFEAMPAIVGDKLDELPGFTMWRIGPSAVVMPTLHEDAPQEVIAVYGERIVASATGTCRVCGGVVTDHRKGVVQAEVFHDSDCPVTLMEGVEEWLDPRALATLRGENLT